MLKPEDVLELNPFELRMLKNLKTYLAKLEIDNTRLEAVRDVARNNLFKILTTYRVMEKREGDEVPLEKYLDKIFSEIMFKKTLKALKILKKRLNLNDDILERSMEIMESFN